MHLSSLFLLFWFSSIELAFAAPTSEGSPLPLLIWHGLGDNYQADGLKEVAKLAEDINPGTYVHLIHLDEDPSSDRTATFFGNVTEQIQQVCDDLLSHPVLSTAPAVNAIGFSQGGQFLRGFIERCNVPKVETLITFGSQHNGISEFQGCKSSDWVCRGSEALLKGNAWTDYAQRRLVPAQYYKNPAELDQYLEHSNFLADINNEREKKNSTYKQNLSSLERFVMMMFEDDTVVVPKETAHFADRNGTEVIPLQKLDIYNGDWLGLKTLDEAGKLEFKTIPGGHMDLSDKLLKEVFRTYLGASGRKNEEASVDEDLPALVIQDEL